MGIRYWLGSDEESVDKMGKMDVAEGLWMQAPQDVARLDRPVLRGLDWHRQGVLLHDLKSFACYLIHCNLYTKAIPDCTRSRNTCPRWTLPASGRSWGGFSLVLHDDRLPRYNRKISLILRMCSQLAFDICDIMLASRGGIKPDSLRCCLAVARGSVIGQWRFCR